uniref:Transient receptor potential cation channel, subfamily C, member 5a n=1 Tax=Astyanax mexicanus TaxID=7994 RepID=A0A8B9H209_ASTMX
MNPMSHLYYKKSSYSPYRDRIPLHIVRAEVELSQEERAFLLAVEKGDYAGVKHALQEAEVYYNIDVNCVDPLGRSALLIAIENENLEVMELLLDHGVNTGDALLYAIRKEVVGAVELLLSHRRPSGEKQVSLVPAHLTAVYTFHYYRYSNRCCHMGVLREDGCTNGLLINLKIKHHHRPAHSSAQCSELHVTEQIFRAPLFREESLLFFLYLLQYNSSRPREEWEMWHPTLMAEALFAIANIFSSLRLISLFTANSHLGPLQISLGRMLLDILKFLFIYCLVLLAFANGLNQLYFYYETQAADEPNHCKGIRCEKQNNAFSTIIQNKHYQEVIRSLVKRYVAAMIRSAKTNEGLTEENFKELKQDISSFRYEVMDLLGNRKPPRRTYSSSSEATLRDEGSDDGHSDGSKAKIKTAPGAGSPYGVSALFHSLSGMEFPTSTTAISTSHREDRPKINGLRKNPSTWSRFTRFSGSKKTSFRRLGLLFSRMGSHLPQPAGVTSATYTISDGLLQPPGAWRDLGISRGDGPVTRSETSLNHADTPAADSVSVPTSTNRQRTNGRDILLTLGPLAPPPSLHCASSFSASSSRLLDSSEDVFQGLVGPYDGHAPDASDRGAEHDDSVTTQL